MSFEEIIDYRKYNHKWSKSTRQRKSRIRKSIRLYCRKIPEEEGSEREKKAQFFFHFILLLEFFVVKVKLTI